MRIRSATPSLILLVIAIVFFVLAICTPPLANNLTLGKYGDVRFGVFGYCLNSNCSKPLVGYNSDYLDEHAKDGFRTSVIVRQRASYGLVIVPVSACICLISTIMTIFAHIGAIARSPGFFNVIGTITFFNIFITAIAFVICVITFVPHIQWPSWLVLANVGIQLIVLLLLLVARRQATRLQAKHLRRATSGSLGYNPYSLQNSSNIFSTSSRKGDLPKFSDYSAEKPMYDTISEDDGLKRGGSVSKLKPTFSNDSRSQSSYAPTVREPVPVPKSNSGFRFPFMRNKPAEQAPENPFRDPENPFKDPASAPAPNPWSINDVQANNDKKPSRFSWGRS
ncbi:hypothetical protein POMI540_4111 [Schizosaccharomyces pombe]